jgi:hypothetical protein
MSANVPVVALIRGNNAVWRLMYYDDLVETPRWQATFLREADAGYYNCAQAVTQLDEGDREWIEKFYAGRGVAPAFYDDPVSGGWLPARLGRHGYSEVHEEAEHWWVAELTEDRIARWGEAKHRLRAEGVSLEEVEPADSEQFEWFLHVDRVANQLPDAIVSKLRRNVLERKLPGVRNHYFLGRVRGAPAFCGSVGLCGDMAFLAEGGTLAGHRRRGLHAEMIRHRALFAARRGARWLAFTCSRSALSNRTGGKLGFELAFARRFFRKEATR